MGFESAHSEELVQCRLLISTRDIDRSQLPLEVGCINSKGFGGNNASAVVLAAFCVCDRIAAEMVCGSAVCPLCGPSGMPNPF